MNTTSEPPFNPLHIELAHFASALSHPARVAIVTLLQEKTVASCGEIVSALPLSQATVSQHIKVLLEAEMLIQIPEGKKMNYQLNRDKIITFCHNFQCTLGTQTSES